MAPHKATHGSPSAVYPHGGFTPDATLGSLPATGKGIIPHLPGYEERDQTASFKDSLADHSDSEIINSPNTPPKVMEQPTRARAFQSPFKLSALPTSAREEIYKKNSNSSSIKKKKKKDELFIPNAQEKDNKFKVAYSVAALLMFFHDEDFKGKTSRGNAFEDCDNYCPPPPPPIIHVAKYPAQATIGKAQHRSAYHPHPPIITTIRLGRHSSFPVEHVPNRYRNGQVSPRTLGLLIQDSPILE
jgi:hypothetical protein